jgi:hypothetical protein
VSVDGPILQPTLFLLWCTRAVHPTEGLLPTVPSLECESNAPYPVDGIILQDLGE